MEAAAHAKLITAHGIRRGIGADHDAATALRAQRDRAADGALCAGRGHPAFGLSRAPLVWMLHQRRSRADVDTGAAEIAVRFVDGAALAELDAGAIPAAGECDGARMTKLVAGANAAGANDAHLRVELEERVRLVGRRLGCGVVGPRVAVPRFITGHLKHLARRLQFATVVLRASEAAMRDNIVTEAGVARLALHHAMAGQAAVGVVRKDQREHCLSRRLKAGRLGADDHPVLDARRTG